MNHIGDVKLQNNLVLAPMVGITDTAFRTICRRFGAGLVYTEMLNANAIYKTNKATLNKLTFSKEEKPVACQLFGANPKMLAYASKIAEEAGADIIDLNLGCPDFKVIKQGAGAALLKRPKKVSELVKEIVNAVKIPVTAKIRTEKNALQIAKLIEEAGASAIAVHGRTVAQAYAGKADWNAIKEIKENIKIPVIANGDVFTPQDAKKIIEATKCDFVMIGRAAMTNPHIFKEINDYLDGKKVEKISAKEKLGLFSEYVELAMKFGCYKFASAKRHATNFTKGIPHSVKLREKMMKAKTIEQLKKEIEDFRTHL